MNIYDEAHALARAMERSAEMQRLVRAKEGLGADSASAKMATRYLALQMEAEYSRMLGKNPDEKVLQEWRELQVLVQNNAAVKEYLEAFARWQVIAGDVQKIIGDVLKAGMPDIEAQETDGQ